MKPVGYTQKPMFVKHVADPVNNSFFIIGDAARGGHAATAAGGQLAGVDGARVAKTWVMGHAEGKPAAVAARFYQRGTAAATRGLMRKAMPWFVRRPEQMRPIQSPKTFPKMDVPRLWKARGEYKAAASARHR